MHREVLVLPHTDCSPKEISFLGKKNVIWLTGPSVNVTEFYLIVFIEFDNFSGDVK